MKHLKNISTERHVDVRSIFSIETFLIGILTNNNSSA